MKPFFSNFVALISKIFIVALMVGSGSASAALASSAEFAADDCAQKNSFVRCTMGFIRVEKVKDLPPGTEGKDPTLLVAPDRTSSKSLELGVAGAMALFDRGLGVAMFLNSFANTTNPAEHMIVFIIMPTGVAGGVRPNLVAADALVEGFKRLLQFTEMERYNHTKYTVKGGDICGEDGCKISSQLFSDMKHAETSLGRHYDRAPAWMGIEGPIYARAVTPRFEKLGPAGTGDAVISQKAAILLSSFLPDYFYVYIPSDDPKTPSAILNAGKVHYAISPGK